MDDQSQPLVAVIKYQVEQALKEHAALEARVRMLEDLKSQGEGGIKFVTLIGSTILAFGGLLAGVIAAILKKGGLQ